MIPAAPDAPPAWLLPVDDSPVPRSEWRPRVTDRVSIHVLLDAEVVLSVTDVWPDDDHPDQITAAAVAAAMTEYGDKAAVLTAWNLIDDLAVTVTVVAPNPNAGQLDFDGREQPRRLHSTADVWAAR